LKQGKVLPLKISKLQYFNAASYKILNCVVLLIKCLKVFVKHTIIVDRETSNNYIIRANSAAHVKFNISHISLWMPKLKPSLKVESEINSKVVKGHIKQLYFITMKVYRTIFPLTEIQKF